VLIRAAAAFLGALLVLTVSSGVAHAGLVCEELPDGSIRCHVEEDVPPGGGGGGGGGGGDDSGDPCGYELVAPQPPATDPIWNDADPIKYDVYLKTCPDAAPVQVVLGAGIGALPPPMDPEVLAAQIIARMIFTGPTIVTAPPQGADSGVVGLPIWMWADPSPATTGPLSDSDAQGGVSVSVTGVVTQIVWGMGDGNSISCGLGTPYPGGGVDTPSPDCGYTYATASTNHVAGGGPWPITATSTWTITWAGGGEAGTESIELTTAGTMPISEIYVLNQSGGG